MIGLKPRSDPEVFLLAVASECGPAATRITIGLPGTVNMPVVIIALPASRLLLSQPPGMPTQPFTSIVPWNTIQQNVLLERCAGEGFESAESDPPPPAPVALRTASPPGLHSVLAPRASLA